MSDDLNPWWSHLAHNGVLVSPIVLADWFPKGVPVVSDHKMDHLRKAYFQFKDDPNELRSWLDALLERFLGHTALGVWRKEQNIPDRFKHQGQKPNWVLLHGAQEHRPRIAVFIDDERVTQSDGTPYRLGRHGGRRSYARMLRLMRQIDVPLGIFTNGHYVRLVYAGLDHDAWAEWDVSSWFLGREGRETLHGLNAMLGRAMLDPAPDAPHNPLLDRIKESREKQADLSHVMGTQVREAVEILLEELTDTLAADPTQAAEILAPLEKVGSSEEGRLQALYQAAIRHIMRLVVVLYAESRTLLPKEEALYYDSYSVEGLYQALKEAALDGHEESLRDLESAWPRLLSLFRLVHDGSDHKDLRIFAYGGQLFRPTPAETQDTVLAALAVFSDPRVRVTDWAIYQILDKLRVGKYKVGRGKWRAGPVDFSDLRTEFIGMMYEGLLDYDLRRARTEDEGIVFLNIGDQPALPLSLLKKQSDADLKKLLQEQGKRKGAADAPDEEVDEDKVEEAVAEAEDALDAAADEDEVEDQDAQEAFLADVHAWARNAVKAGHLFGCTPAKLKKLDKPEQDRLIDKAAAQLVLRAVPSGGMYLVRWSGTRKGSGTFYTKPGLAVPTTIRTLEPLAYENHEDRENRVPRLPSVILDLKVCDPAMGSGSFLVAALRFLTQALKESWDHHVQPRIDAGEKTTVEGERAIGLLAERIMEVRGGDDAEERIEAALRRLVVEHCIYGVDLNPLAVELGKLSLWIETLDPRLSFTFLDHKIKCGNSLIGASRHQAHIYPLAAWDRQLGDGASNPRTKRAKRIRKEVILPELKVWLDGWELKDGVSKRKKPKLKPADAQTSLFGGKAQQVQLVDTTSSPRLERIATQTTFAAVDDDTPWEDYQALVVSKLDEIHGEIDPRFKEEMYHEVIDSDAYRHRKHELDKWCAVWFWPIQAPEDLPLDAEPMLGPKEFTAKSQSASVHKVIEDIAAKHRFLHWELEFPDVFGDGRFGFDAIVGNPPWEAVQPSDIEFFTRYDPAFGSFPKQSANKRRTSLFNAHASIKSSYWDYLESISASKHYWRSGPGSLGSKKLDEKWEAIQGGRKNPAGYRLQGGGDLNLYKLFWERFFHLASTKARCGVITPLGINLDAEGFLLRKEMLERSAVEFSISFWNKDRIFQIPSQNRFTITILQRGARTHNIVYGALIRKPLDIAGSESELSLVSVETLRRVSPNTLAIPELSGPDELAALIEISRKGIPFGQAGLEFGRELHTTDDSPLFQEAHKLLAEGLSPVNGIDWKLPNGEAYRPVVQGKMVHQLDGVYQGINETGNWVKWFGDQIPWMSNRFIKVADYLGHPKRVNQPKICFRTTTQPTINPRSMLAALVPDCPSVHTLSTLRAETWHQALLSIAAVTSYVFDFMIRSRISGMYVGEYVLNEARMPTDWGDDELRIVELAACLNLSPLHFPQGVEAVRNMGIPHEFESDPGRRSAAREELDELVARAYGLNAVKMRNLLRPDNPDPRALWKDYRERLKVLEAAGHRGKWYTLEEAREIRRNVGMKVDF